jgi:Holliday junction resolvase RusA-like endonuclease
MSATAENAALWMTNGAGKPELVVVVYGTAQAAGSKRGFIMHRGRPTERVVITDANRNAKSWKDQVAQQAGLAMHGRELLRGPLEVEFTFYRKRPQGHVGARGVKPSAPRFPTTKPDVLKLARGVEDAMTGVVYADDAQIVREVLVKEYGEPERCLIVVRSL